MLHKYLDEVFIQIVDIYGFVSIYYVLLDLLYDNHDVLKPNEKELFKKIKDLFIKYMYSPCVKPFHLDELVSELERITMIFDESGGNITGIPKSHSQIILKEKNKPRRIEKPILLKNLKT
jgi:hypothetical protein